jgi:hypothetical protein
MCSTGLLILRKPRYAIRASHYPLFFSSSAQRAYSASSVTELSCIQRSLRAYEMCRIGRIGRIFKFCAFGLHQLFGFFHSLLDSCVFPCFQIGEFLFCRPY